MDTLIEKIKAIKSTQAETQRLTAIMQRNLRWYTRVVSFLRLR